MTLSIGILFHPRIDPRLPALAEVRGLLEKAGIPVWEVPRERGGRGMGRQLARTRLVLTMGGDGTLLYGARLAAPYGIPVLGVNLGRLGFLTEVEAHEVGSGLGRFLAGDFRVEERTLVRTSVQRGEARVHRSLGLNKAVVHRPLDASLIRFRIEIGGQEVGVIDADGVLVSTATGSTAYSLAVGGPILEPEMAGLVMVPMNPFALTVRPIVCSPGQAITLDLPRSRALLSVDGRSNRLLRQGDSVRVEAYERTLKLVRFTPPQRFYGVLREKLGWGLPLVPFPAQDDGSC